MPEACSSAAEDGLLPPGSRLSIIMPAHNLGPALAANVRSVRAVFRNLVAFEIVVVDDGSLDNTGPELDAVAREFPDVMAVHLQENRGKGVALFRGFEAATGTHVLMLDADLDLPPDQAPALLKIMSGTGADIVIGSKRHPESVLKYPWHRRITSAVYYAMVKTLLGLPVSDTQTGLKLFRREVLEHVIPRMLVKRFAFDLELLTIAHLRGYRIAEAPVRINFHASLGCLRPLTIHQVMVDTLAIFYRSRILRYYQSLGDRSQPADPPLVSVIVACPAPSPYLDECLAGLSAQRYRNFEVILLPDAPSGRAWEPCVHEVPTGRIRPAEKRNIGIEKAQGGIVAFLDDDTWPVDEWLDRAVSHFSDPAVAAVGGPAVTPPGEPYLASLGGRVFSNLLVSGPHRFRYAPGRERAVDDFPSCNLLVRTDVLRRLGGFRTEFWPGEDTYLCMQITKELGAKILYDPWVQVFHHRRRLFLPHLRQVARYALHRGHFARRFPATSRRLSYMLPSLLAFGLVGGGAVAALVPPLSRPYLACAGLYAAITLAAAFPWEQFLVTMRVNPVSWLLVWAGIVLTHVVYGARFAAGLLMPRMPGEVRRFDHPSEEK